MRSPKSNFPLLNSWLALIFVSFWISRSLRSAGSSNADRLLFLCNPFGIYLLGRPNRRAILDRLSGNAGQNVLESCERPDGIEIIVVYQVRNAEQLALHLTLPVGDYGAE